MPTYQTSGRYGLPALVGASNVVSDIDDWSATFRDLVDSLIATGYSGPVSNRPTSTTASPGKLGRFWWATDEGILYFDTGKSWLTIPSLRVISGPPTFSEPRGTVLLDTLNEMIWFGNGNDQELILMGRKEISGFVHSDGTAGDPAGDYVSSFGSGLYTVNFRFQFNNPPIVNVTVVGDTATEIPRVAQISNVSETSFQVNITTSNTGFASSRGFHFRAEAVRH